MLLISSSVSNTVTFCLAFANRSPIFRPFFAPNGFVGVDVFLVSNTECLAFFLGEGESCLMLFVKLREMCRDEMREVVGQPSDNLTGIPHPDEVSYVLELEAAVSRPLSEHRILLKIEPFPGPVDLNVAFGVKRADAGGRALEVASVNGSAEFVFVSELDVVHFLSTPQMVGPAVL